MKNYTLIIVAFFATLNLQAQEGLKVVTTASIFADMAENIIGDQGTVQTIVPIGEDPHTYEPTPRDAQLIADAELVFKNALTFEGWLEELIDNSGTKAEVITVTDGITPITSLQYKNASDPHAWMDVSLGLTYIKNIKDALVKMRPEGKEVFEFNYGVYKKQLEDLDAYITEKVRALPISRRVLITSHDAFQYYGKRYGIRLESVLGTSTDAEVQTSDIVRLNKVIQENDIPAVFIESTVNPKLLKQLASDNDIKIGGQLYADSIGEKGTEGGSYIGMLKFNTDVIVKALSQETVKSDNGDNHNHEGNESTNWLMWAILGGLLVLGFVMVANKLRN